MKIENITYKELQQKSNDDRLYFETLYGYIEPLPVDGKETFTFGQVEQLCDVLQDVATYEQILKVVQIVFPNMNENSAANIIFGAFNGIGKAIAEILELEQSTLSSPLTAKEINAMEAVGGFDKFGRLPLLKQLAEGDVTKFDKIRATKWNECFPLLVLNKVTNDYQNQLWKND